MKIVRFMDGHQEKWGTLQDEKINLIEGSIFGDFKVVDQSLLLKQKLTRIISILSYI